MRPWRRAAGLALAGLVILLLSAAVAFAFLFYRPLPTTDGDQRLVGLEARAEVVRDAAGVPHVFARTTHDVFFLQGYVTAQDRLFQLDLLRRTARGELSALLGADALEADRVVRTVGLARSAALDAALLSDDARAALEAFADGVNKYLDQRGDALPAEFILLGARPLPWSALDSLAILRLEAWELAPDAAATLVRAHVAARGGAELLALLFPGPLPSALADPAWPAVRDDVAAAGALLGPAALDAVAGPRGSGLGGSCVALAGRRSASGAPLLAADPHLPLRDRSGWYAIGLHGGGYDVAGLSLPGLPGVVVGENARVAWGLVRAEGPAPELVVEHPDPADPTGQDRTRTATGASPITVRHEEIAVRGQAGTAGLEVRSTVHGPVVGAGAGGALLALRWIGETGLRTLDGLLGIDRATDLAGFAGAAAQLGGLALAACYADADGHLAAFGPSGAASAAALPLPGWTAVADRPVDAGGLTLLRADPAEGRIAIVADGPGAARAPEAGGERSTYLGARLRDLGPATADALRALQSDASAPPVMAFRAVLLDALPRTAAGRDALARIRAWDGTLATGSAAAAVYEAWLDHFAERSVRTVLGAAGAREYLAAGPAETALRALVDRPDDAWAGPLADPDARGRAAVAGLALDDAVADLAARLGPDPAGWRWGALHRLTLAHPLDRWLGPLAGLFRVGPFERPGDGWSLNDGGVDLGRPYAVRSHATARLVVDLADPDAAAAVLPTGESGQPLGAHFGDQAALWLRGELAPLLFHRDRIAGDTLVLRPR